MGMFMSMKRPI